MERLTKLLYICFIIALCFSNGEARGKAKLKVKRASNKVLNKVKHQVKSVQKRPSHMEEDRKEFNRILPPAEEILKNIIDKNPVTSNSNPVLVEMMDIPQNIAGRFQNTHEGQDFQRTQAQVPEFKQDRFREEFFQRPGHDFREKRQKAAMNIYSEEQRGQKDMINPDDWPIDVTPPSTYFTNPTIVSI